MDTTIGYLGDLRNELLEAAWRESMTSDVSGGGRKGGAPHRYRRVIAGLAAAALLIAGAGYSALSFVDREGGPAAISMTTAEGAPRTQRMLEPGGAEKLAISGNTLTAWSTDLDVRDPSDYTAHDAGLAQSAGPALAANASAPLPSLEQIIKTGSLTVVVPRGSFQESLQEANDVAATYGGYIQSSSTDGTRAGSLKIRVPAESFEAAIGDLQALGEVEHESTNGQDVSAEFVDLEARLRIAQTRESVMERLMQRAKGVSEVLRLRDVLEEAQLNVEQLKGQLRVLHDRSSLGTISLSLREEGVSAVGEGGGLLGALGRALAGFLRVAYAMIIGLGYLLPVALVAGLVWWVLRRNRRRGGSGLEP